MGDELNLLDVLAVAEGVENNNLLNAEKCDDLGKL